MLCRIFDRRPPSRTVRIRRQSRFLCSAGTPFLRPGPIDRWTARGAAVKAFFRGDREAARSVLEGGAPCRHAGTGGRTSAASRNGRGRPGTGQAGEQNGVRSVAENRQIETAEPDPPVAFVLACQRDGFPAQCFCQINPAVAPLRRRPEITTAKNGRSHKWRCWPSVARQLGRWRPKQENSTADKRRWTPISR